MLKRILPKAYAALLLYLGFAPLFLLPAAALLPDRVWLAALLPVPALLLTGFAGLANAKRRTAALLLVIFAVAAGCFFLFRDANPPAMLLFLPCLLVMLIFMPAMTRPAHREWRMSYLTCGFVLHIAAQVLKGIAVFEPVAAPLTWFFTVFIALSLFYVNRLMLADTGESASKTLLFANRRLLTGLCLLALLLANLKAVGAAFRTVIAWIIVGIFQIITWITSLIQTTSDSGSPQGGNPLDLLPEASEPGLFARILEIALIVFGVLLAAVLLFFLAKFFARTIKKVFHAFLERLKLYRQQISADYDDKSESLLHWGEIRETAKARLARIRRRYLPTPWEKLSPAQRVRRVYALLLRRQAAPDPALTARETLQSGAIKIGNGDAAQVASLYERARYSSHPIAAQEADELRKRAGV